MPNAQLAKLPVNEVFESRPCSRCGGDAAAFASFGHVNAGRCLKCDGTTFALTARGAAAVEYLNSLSPQVKGDALEPGRKYRQNGSTAPAFRVAEVVDANVVRDATGCTHNYERVGGLAAVSFRLLLTADEREQNIQRALAFQATLDRDGKAPGHDARIAARRVELESTGPAAERRAARRARQLAR